MQHLTIKNAAVWMIINKSYMYIKSELNEFEYIKVFFIVICLQLWCMQNKLALIWVQQRSKSNQTTQAKRITESQAARFHPAEHFVCWVSWLIPYFIVPFWAKLQYGRIFITNSKLAASFCFLLSCWAVIQMFNCIVDCKMEWWIKNHFSKKFYFKSSLLKKE